MSNDGFVFTKVNRIPEDADSVDSGHDFPLLIELCRLCMAMQILAVVSRCPTGALEKGISDLTTAIAEAVTKIEENTKQIVFTQVGARSRRIGGCHRPRYRSSDVNPDTTGRPPWNAVTCKLSIRDLLGLRACRDPRLVCNLW